ncbi:MAG: hypothetical protein ACRELC_02450, partial [Gemmatimonadota bacterium]
DAIIGVLYEVISGPAGEERDWNRFRSLFLPEGRLIPTGRTEAGAHFHRVLSPDEWIEGAEPFFEQNGFFEREIARATEEFGKVAHAFSTYESRYIAEDLEPFQRGINSIQLLHDGTRWWVATVLWMGETPEHPIPAVYLPASP